MATKKFRTKSHKHELQLKSYTKPYICDGCKERGFGSRYRCEKCDYDLHQYCMETTPSTSHDFFPNSTFNLYTTPPKACHKHCKRRCDACRKPINGFVYHCKKDDLDLHPCCRNLKREYTIKGEGEGEEELKFILHKNMKQKCLWCNKKSIKEGGRSNGWSYISKCNRYHVHVTCVTEMFLEVWNNKNETINKINCNVKEDNLKALALHKVDLKEIQAKKNGHGKSGKKYWKILKVILTIVSIVLGEPTMIVASSLLEALHAVLSNII
ncbi:uncharacterized protein LOC101213112 [Cucumis sativus]|uniref:Phorbol-ester/DAG-type domain-containing protein n=1 Tax=Cucumis sativus TaxID=3659 RepID=A0A0A0KU87_CUCSA|nr:uncharacterized protein LOC101213112 [Cucumis sativus]